METSTNDETMSHPAPGGLTVDHGTSMDDMDSEDYGDNDENDDDDDDSSMMIHVPLLESSSEVTPKILDQPPEGFEWNDNAILECLELAIKSHDQDIIINNDDDDNTASDNPSINYDWYPTAQQTTNPLASWQPKPLPLPVWAKDPFTELLEQKQVESSAT